MPGNAQISGPGGLKQRWLDPNVREGELAWPSAADVGIPALLLFVNLVGWPVIQGLTGELPERLVYLSASLISVAACAALVWRRKAPFLVMAVCLVCAMGNEALPSADVRLGSPLWTLLPMFSLAVQRGRHVIPAAVLAATGETAWLTAINGWEWVNFFGFLAVTVALYFVIIAFGRARRLRKERQRRLAARLAEAERERRAVAAAERERLARELHDVAGHHLSAIVVHTGAAARLADRKPELAADALRVAADSGQEILSSLTSLVDVVGEPEPADRTDTRLETMLLPLRDGLARLGIPVTLTVRGTTRPLPAEVTAAAYRITQESLTNAMRYATGAPVAIAISYLPDAVELLVANEPLPTTEPYGPELGSGRGINGMRERAASVGGELTAGRSSDGGWSVRATLPTPTAPRRRLDWPMVLDAVVIALCAGLALLIAFLPPDAVVGELSPASVLCTIVIAAHPLPLWWRRTAPYRCAAALIAIDLLWITSGVTGIFERQWLDVMVIAWFAELIAVYSLAAYARRPLITLPAPFIAPHVAGLAAAVAAGGAEVEKDWGAYFVAYPILLIPLMLGSWGWGRLVRARRDKIGRWERDVLAVVAAHADQAVASERNRVAEGLRGTVISRTVRLVANAEAALDQRNGSASEAILGGVADDARAALDGMRELLDIIDDEARVSE